MVVLACGTCQVQPFLSLQLDGVISGWRPLAKVVAATTGWLLGGRPIQRLLTGSAGLTFKALSHWHQAAYRYGESRATLVVWWANSAAIRTPERRVWDDFLGSLTGEGGVQMVSFRGSHTGRLAACTRSQRLLLEVGGFFFVHVLLYAKQGRPIFVEVGSGRRLRKLSREDAAGLLLDFGIEEVEEVVASRQHNSVLALSLNPWEDHAC